MAAIEVESLRVLYGERAAVDGITFSAEKGEVLALLGPNGAGKTTTVETLEGYRRPTSGRVRVLGLDPVADHANLVKRVGVVLQRGGVYPMMSTERVLELFASYYEDPRPPGELIELLGLTEVVHTPYKRLSGGEQQRVALGLALVGRPEVVFLDEPTAGVDPAGRIAVRDVVSSLRDEGACILLT
ncbi:MAG: ABC transporter ATP-binding protein, partial [Acidimicrobiales bacterium]